ncbi:hypothetical protein [Metallosphaera javensis (ex Sakai et al. 2022)]|uniref:hypothetical protein n=1 Tax=Metallosphaera javensis (ex Sakai et al. 2022) TaxID=2775498 RepID=UPI00258C5235|nr:MAG: hypothetical protein MjAS7_0952 [Metallosphaera javensis (ex Sakai et al. 2022)]
MTDKFIPDELIEMIHERLGIPTDIISAVISVVNLPLLPMAVTSLTFFSLFATLFVHWYRHRSLDSIKEEYLDREENRLILENEEKERKLRVLYERRKVLKERISGSEGLDKIKHEKDLQAVENEIKVLEAEYEENLDRIAFVRSLETLIKHKRYLKEKGIWDKLDDIRKKVERENQKIEMSMLKHAELREFLSRMNVETDIIAQAGK